MAKSKKTATKKASTRKASRKTARKTTPKPVVPADTYTGTAAAPEIPRGTINESQNDSPS